MSRAKVTGGIYILWALLLAGIGVTALVMVGAAGLGVIAIVAPEHWPQDLQIRTAISGFSLPTVTGYGRATYCTKLLLQGAVVALILLPLAGIVRTVIRSTPFVAVNVLRLRVIGGVFALVAIARSVGPLLDPVRSMIWLEATPSPQLDVRGLAMALLCATLAEVFREGLQLRIDSEGTI